MRRAAFMAPSVSSSHCADASSRPLRRFVQDEQLGLGIDRVREQDAPQFAAREHRERTRSRPGQADALEQLGDFRARAGADAEAHRTPLARQREEVSTVTGSVGSTAKVCGT